MMTVDSMIRNVPNIDRLLLTALNPKFDAVKAYGGSNMAGIPPYIKFYTENPDGTVNVPRNFHSQEGMVDNRVLGKDIDISFTGTLRPTQEFLKTFELGIDTILNAYCGFGKSISGAYLISRIKKQTLIICPTTFLCKQWKTELDRFLSSPYSMMGINSAIVKSSSQIFMQNDIVIMTYSLASKLSADRLSVFGCVILDEGHKIGANTYAPIMEKLPAKERILLTATWYRQGDKVLDIMRYHFKRIIPIKSDEPPAKMYFVETDFSINPRFVKGFNAIEKETNSSPIRQNVIHGIIKECLNKNYLPIIMGKRKDALKQLSSHYPDGVLLTSETMKIKDTVDKVRSEAKSIFGISQLIREGVDIQKASVLIIVTPHGSIEQAIGRVIRKMEGKKAPIIIFLYDNISAYANTISKSLDNIPNALYISTINHRNISSIL